MKILVTGGAGFIASHVVDAYVARGHTVVIVDNISSGFRRNINKKAKFYKADIRNLTALRKIFKKEKPDMVNHHAAVSEVIKSVRDPGLTYDVNILGTANLLLAAGEVKVKKFIFISTGGALYGNPKNGVRARENTPPNPLSPYALSKVIGETLVQTYAKWYRFPYLIFRYANVYGPRQNPRGEAGVIAIFTRLICGGGRPRIFGDGTKTRDYVYVEDIARANVLGLRKGKNEILNLGVGREITDQKVFDEIAKNLEYKKPPIYAPFRKGEVYRIALNSSRAKRILGWKARVRFEEGVKRYLESRNDAET